MCRIQYTTVCHLSCHISCFCNISTWSHCTLPFIPRVTQKLEAAGLWGSSSHPGEGCKKSTVTPEGALVAPKNTRRRRVATLRDGGIPIEVDVFCLLRVFMIYNSKGGGLLPRMDLESLVACKVFERTSRYTTLL